VVAEETITYAGGAVAVFQTGVPIARKPIPFPTAAPVLPKQTRKAS
jgi:hypothetical protein